MGSAPGCPQPQHNPPTGLSRELPSLAGAAAAADTEPRSWGLCEAAGVAGSYPPPAGEGQAEAGIRDRVEAWFRHCRGSWPRAGLSLFVLYLAQPFSAPAAEVTPEVGRLPRCRDPHPQTLLPLLGGGSCPLPVLSTPTSPAGLSEPFLRNFRPPWNSRRRSSGLVDGSLLPFLSPPCSLMGEPRPGSGAPRQPRAFSPHTACAWGRLQERDAPCHHPLFSLGLRGPTETPVASGAPDPCLRAQQLSLERPRHGRVLP